MAKKKKTEDEGGAEATARKADTAVRVAAHPRASASIRRLRGRAGLGAFGRRPQRLRPPPPPPPLPPRGAPPLASACARGGGPRAPPPIFAVWFAAVLV